MATWHIRNSPCGRRQSTPRQLTCACEQGIYPRKQCESQLTSREDRDRNGQREPEVYSQREGGSLDMRTMLRSKATLLFLTVALLLAGTAIAAIAAELVTAEVDADTNATAVEVEQGKSANFNIQLSATGNLAAAT